MLTSIFSYRTAKNDSKVAVNEVLFVLAQVYSSAGQLDKARENATKALEGTKFNFILVYESTLGREHSLSIEVRAFLKALVKN